MATVIRGSDNFDTADNATQTELNSGLAGKMSSTVDVGKVLQFIYAEPSVKNPTTVSGANAFSTNYITANITTQANSRLYFIYWTGQLDKDTNTNPIFRFRIDGTSSNNFDETNHIFFSDGGADIRPAITFPHLSAPLSAGSHNIALDVGNHTASGSVTYNYQHSTSNERHGHLYIMEIAE